MSHGGHHCHWPGCESEVPPKLWGCRTHWFMLPKYIRDKIWDAYVPGQEITKTPSRRYIEVAREAREWILKNHPEPPGPVSEAQAREAVLRVLGDPGQPVQATLFDAD